LNKIETKLRRIPTISRGLAIQKTVTPDALIAVISEFFDRTPIVNIVDTRAATGSIRWMVSGIL